jgi:hypothetical protein
VFKHSLIKRSLVTGLVIGSASFPAMAQARFNFDPPLPSPSAPNAVVNATPVQPAASTPSAFQWGDAGIGAAGTVVLLGAGAGAAGAVRRRRVHRPLTD